MITMDKAKKEKLINLLKIALEREEKAIPIYHEHLKSAIFWAGLPGEKANKIKDALQLLAMESTTHKQTVEDILAKLNQES